MPAIEIRPATSADITSIMNLDHDFTSDHVFQMDLQLDEDQVEVQFRLVHLPRSVRVEYPHSPKKMADDWTGRSGLLVAVLAGKPVGYVSMMQDLAPTTTWVSDLVVSKAHRRQGIGSAMLLAAQEWAAGQAKSRRLVLEMQPKNYPAIRLAQKLGFEFCGYQDHHYSNNDVAIFFEKWVV